MVWTLKGDRPIYQQLVDQITMLVVSGTLQPGEKVLPVRELATEAGVNPNTMQRALAELERGGLLYSNRTSGRYVTEDATMIKTIREELAADRIQDFLGAMMQLGFSKNETVSLIEKLGKEGNSSERT